MTRLTDDLEVLHDGYVDAINYAVAADDLDGVHRLAAEYDEEARALVAAHEGRSVPVPIRPGGDAGSSLRSLVRRFTFRRVA